MVITTNRIADSVLTCRWSDAVTHVFEMTRRQIDLTKIEDRAPGREVAFLVKAQERFALAGLNEPAHVVHDDTVQRSASFAH
jgi:hypothetical protein